MHVCTAHVCVRVTHDFFLSAGISLAPEAFCHHALLDIHEGHIPLVQARQKLAVTAELDLPSAEERRKSETEETKNTGVRQIRRLAKVCAAEKEGGGAGMTHGEALGGRLFYLHISCLKRRSRSTD